MPPTVDVVAPGDGNRVLVCQWPDGEQVLVVFTEEAAKEVGKGLLAPSVQITDKLPPGLQL